MFTRRSYSVDGAPSRIETEVVSRAASGFVGERESVVEGGHALLDLLARDHERRADHDHVPVRHEVEAPLERGLRHARDGRKVLAARVEGHERLPRVPGAG